MATIADLFTKYNCTNCQDDIQGIRVHCAECENFDLCLQVRKKFTLFFIFITTNEFVFISDSIHKRVREKEKL